MDTKRQQKLVRIFKALANPNRLAIYEAVKKACGGATQDSPCRDQDNTCVGALAAEVRLAPSTVSEHLKELREAGLIQMEKRGLWVYCSMNKEALAEIEAFLE